MIDVIFDFLFADNWEEFRRIRLYKKVGNRIEKPENQKTKKIFQEI